jgi:glycosyltransferase involved in cell wall biosynthesis
MKPSVNLLKNKKKPAIPRISVLTPTWNRAEYLNRVWKGLNAQNFRDFEWIVANDGSQDDTIEVIRELAHKSDFSVTLITASQRVGKSRIDNEAVAASRGDFILWCDSDDYLLPCALEKLLNTWLTIAHEDREKFCGVTALCDTKEGGSLGNKFYQLGAPIDITWCELSQKLAADMVIFTRADLLKQTPFLEVDFLIPESSVWNEIGILKTRFIPTVLQRKHYGEVNALSFSGYMAYNRGYAYAKAKNKSKTLRNPFLRKRIWDTVNYLRYCLHGEISFKQSILNWEPNWFECVLLLVSWPLSVALALKDQIQGKVLKTHREFLVAKDMADIKLEVLKYKD